eukprot:SAG11_NODE_2796_length_2960_cov_3.574275_4_plen_31_part_01
MTFEYIINQIASSTGYFLYNRYYWVIEFDCR